MFNWKYDIALNPMQYIRAKSHDEGDVSWDFLCSGRNLGNLLELQRGRPLETPLGSAKSGFLSS